MSKEVVTVTVTEPSTTDASNFRSFADIENFYRFLHENDLRREALFMLRSIYVEQTAILKKARRKAKKKNIQ